MPGRIPAEIIMDIDENGQRIERNIDPIELRAEIERMLQFEAAIEKQAALEFGLRTKSMKRAAEYEQRGAIFDVEVSKFQETLKRLKEEWIRGYNQDWISSVLALMVLADGIGTVVGAYDPFGKLIGVVNESLGLADLITEKFDKLTYDEPPKKALPELRFHAKMDAKGVIDLTSLKDMCRSDGKPMFPDQLAADPRVAKVYKALERQLKVGLVVWLEALGYKPEQKPGPDGTPMYTGAYVDASTGEKLTASDFNEYRDNEQHPEQSFAAFLKGEFGPEFKHESYMVMAR